MKEIREVCKEFHRHEEPKSPRRFNACIPLDLEAIVLKCLEKDRARRYTTAGDLAD